MADKPTLSRAFNQHFIDFVDDIIRIYPDNRDVLKLKTSFETVKKANPSLAVKAWYQKVYTPYSQFINNGDINFFFDKDYSQDLKTVSNGGEIMKMIDQIREPVRTMNDENKDHCMKYIKNLSKISVAYSSM